MKNHFVIFVLLFKNNSKTFHVKQIEGFTTLKTNFQKFLSCFQQKVWTTLYQLFYFIQYFLVQFSNDCLFF